MIKIGTITFTKKEQALYDLLQEKGLNVIDVWYCGGFNWHPDTGWWCEDIENNWWKLGKDFTEAKGQIESGEIQIKERYV